MNWIGRSWVKCFRKFTFQTGFVRSLLPFGFLSCFFVGCLFFHFFNVEFKISWIQQYLLLCVILCLFAFAKLSLEEFELSLSDLLLYIIDALSCFSSHCDIIIRHHWRVDLWVEGLTQSCPIPPHLLPSRRTPHFVIDLYLGCKLAVIIGCSVSVQPTSTTWHTTILITSLVAMTPRAIRLKNLLQVISLLQLSRLINRHLYWPIYFNA